MVTAKAGGAQKVYWIHQRDGGIRCRRGPVRLHADAGRVTGDESLTLQFKAVYADTVKTMDIPVTIKEDIPEPVFTLKAPARGMAARRSRWCRRSPICRRCRRRAPAN